MTHIMDLIAVWEITSEEKDEGARNGKEVRKS
jgi:hypothetical protein